MPKKVCSMTAFSELVCLSSHLYWSFFLPVFYYEKCQT